MGSKKNLFPTIKNRWLSVREKAQRRIKGKIVSALLGKGIYPCIYRSYWHYILRGTRVDGNLSTLYYSARPNPGAGIGHQMANWIAGYWFARQFGINYAYLPFASKEWERFLGFGHGEVSVGDLRKIGYKVRRLPKFDENDSNDIMLQKNIIASYADCKVIFVAEQDQFYKNQYGVIADIQAKFYSAPSRKEDRLLYDSSCYNIAVHVRRGDILSDPDNPGLRMRYLSNDYYYQVLKGAFSYIKTNKPIHVYLFSQGEPDDYPEFSEMENLHWCMDMDAKQSFLHMVYADALITSKSSFSYKPALLNKGIKFCPKNFWHGYPQSDDWLLCDDDGNFCI